MITRASCFHATRNFRARSRVLCANQPLVDFGGGFIRRTKKNVFYARRTLNITYPRSAQTYNDLRTPRRLN